MRIWVFGAAAAGICGYFLNLWVTSHSLGVEVGEHYAVVAVGWKAFGLTVGAGFLAGALLVMLANLGEGIAKFFDFLIEKERRALIKERKQIEADKAGFDAEIRQAAATGRQAGAQMADAAELDLREAMGRIKGIERQVGMFKGRLKGSQLKAANLKKKTEKLKTLLTRGDTPKPGTV